MFSNIWTKIKTPFTWLNAKWKAFETWFDSLIPGLKILLVNGLTVIGTSTTMAAAYMQEVPLDKFVNAKTLAVVLLVVSSLSFWLRTISLKNSD